MTDKPHMLRWAGKIVGLFVFLLAGAGALWFYQTNFSTSRQIIRLEEEKRVLGEVVQRLSGEKRVAEIMVTSQTTVGDKTETTLLFLEYDKQGKPLPPKTFTVDGTIAHIDALVIKFDRGFVSSGDALRGQSLALFTRIYGEKQAPADAFPIDEPGKIPEIYRGTDPRISAFETKLWQDFWKLADDSDFRAAQGVRVANGQGVWIPFAPDKLYTVTLESDGGLNINSEPLKGIYKDMFRQRFGSARD